MVEKQLYLAFHYKIVNLNKYQFFSFKNLAEPDKVPPVPEY